MENLGETNLKIFICHRTKFESEAFGVQRTPRIQPPARGDAPKGASVQRSQIYGNVFASAHLLFSLSRIYLVSEWNNDCDYEYKFVTCRLIVVDFTMK